MNNSILKGLALVAFITFMFISCWATVDSLILLLPNFPKLIFWIATLGSFFLASMGSKLIIDSFNNNIYMQNRGWKLLGGMLLMLLFWIIFSLPTNTHTFYYRSAIKDVLTQDITDTKSRLLNLYNEVDAKRIIELDKANFIQKIRNGSTRFKKEIYSYQDEGWGERAELVIVNLEKDLGPIQRSKLKSKNLKDLQAITTEMSNQIEILMDAKIESVYNTRLRNINSSIDKNTLKSLMQELDKVQRRLTSGNNKIIEPSENTALVLSQSYKMINNYSDLLINEFETSHPDQIKLTREDKKYFSGVSKTEKMRSVIEVWKEFFQGKYDGRGFVFWIILASLVDIAGFLFFSLAFKRNEY
jgi:hypothetical protein